VAVSLHIGAKDGQIAKSILLPGDPLRAKFIAEQLLDGAECFNQVRGMNGYTGTYKGKLVSVMGTGMGMPSHSIYVHELIVDYQVENLVRVGTCGAIQKDLKIGDLVLAMTASTDSQMNKLVFNGIDFAPSANFDLLLSAWQAAQARGLKVDVGGILSSDIFYNDEDPDWWVILEKYGIKVVEMETSALYSLAARFNARALSILTVSDNIQTGENASHQQREQGFLAMAELALEIVP
jgi:purine-nucleoside phosphorylase